MTPPQRGAGPRQSSISKAPPAKKQHEMNQPKTNKRNLPRKPGWSWHLGISIPGFTDSTRLDPEMPTASLETSLANELKKCVRGSRRK